MTPGFPPSIMRLAAVEETDLAVNLMVAAAGVGAA